jgi:hypothetical protein
MDFTQSPSNSPSHPVVGRTRYSEEKTLPKSRLLGLVAAAGRTPSIAHGEIQLRKLAFQSGLDLSRTLPVAFDGPADGVGDLGPVG